MSLNTYPYNPFPASTDKLDEAHNAELQQEVDQLKEDTGELQEDVEKLETDKTDTAVIAPEFDAEAGVYAVGDLVMYQGKLYEFTAAHETAGDWDSTEVTEKTVSDEIDTVKSGLTNVIPVTPTPIYSEYVESGASINAYKLGKIVMISMQYIPVSGSIATNNVVLTGLPIPLSDVYVFDGYAQLKLNLEGKLIYWYPSNTTTLDRRSYTITYLTA